MPSMLRRGWTVDGYLPRPPRTTIVQKTWGGQSGIPKELKRKKNGGIKKME